MARDWIWGWVGAVASIIVAFLAIKAIGLFPERPGLAAGLALALAATLSTGLLWIKNRHSLLKIKQAGGEIKLIIRPGDALLRAVILFPTIFGTLILLRLVVDGQIIDWGQNFLFSGVMSYIMGLTNTAYKKSE